MILPSRRRIRSRSVQGPKVSPAANRICEVLDLRETLRATILVGTLNPRSQEITKLAAALAKASERRAKDSGYQNSSQPKLRDDSFGIQNSGFDDSPGGGAGADGGRDGYAFPPRDSWPGRLWPAHDGVHQLGRYQSQREED